MIKNARSAIMFLGLTVVVVGVISYFSSKIKHDFGHIEGGGIISHYVSTGWFAVVILFYITIYMVVKLLIKTNTETVFPPPGTLFENPPETDPIAIKELLARVGDAEGFTEIEAGSYWNFIGSLVKNADLDEAGKRMLLFEFTLLFAKEKPEFRMYLGYARQLYIMLLLTKKQLYQENVIIKNNPKPQDGKSLQLSVVSLEKPGHEGTIPGFIREFILRNDGNYPVGPLLDSIFIGRGGIYVAAIESDKTQEIYNLLKFTRELVGLLEG